MRACVFLWSSVAFEYVNIPSIYAFVCMCVYVFIGQVEAMCPLEPDEVEDLRCFNDYPPSTFQEVLESARQAFPSGR